MVTFVEAEQTIMERSLVLKLLPTDPPGRSGYVNDTRGAPLTTVLWDQYYYLSGLAIDELFSRARRDRLGAMSGREIFRLRLFGWETPSCC